MALNSTSQVTITVYFAVFISKTVCTYVSTSHKIEVDFVPRLEMVVFYELDPFISSKIGTESCLVDIHHIRKANALLPSIGPQHNVLILISQHV